MKKIIFDDSWSVKPMMLSDFFQTEKQIFQYTYFCEFVYSIQIFSLNKI